MKYLSIKLAKYVQNEENYKIQMKEINNKMHSKEKEKWYHNLGEQTFL